MLIDAHAHIDLYDDLLERGVYCTVGVEVLFSDEIKKIAREIPDDLLLTETDNPGGLKWLTGEPGMPIMIKDVVQTLARLSASSADVVMQTVQRNLTRVAAEQPEVIGGLRSLRQE